MASLKDLRGRINSVKSTRKFTQAMKMVAAATLRRAQAQAEAARPYAERMEQILASLGAAVASQPGAPKLLVGTGADKVHLLVVVTGDRGLAGPFNSQIGRLARNKVRALEAEGKQVKLLSVGRKGAAYLKREFASRFVGEFTFLGRKKIGFEDAEAVGRAIVELLEQGGFDDAGDAHGEVAGEGVERFLPVTSVDHQLGLTEQGQVGRDARLGQPEDILEFADRQLAAVQQMEHP